MSETILQVKNLNVAYGSARVVSGVDFALNKGEVLALVGESGCGKSSASLALIKLLSPQAKISADAVDYSIDGRSVDLSRLSPRELRKFRGSKIACIFQEPSVSLNPVMTVRAQIAEVLDLHRKDIKDQDAEIIRLLSQVGIPDAANRLKTYPHELSGGMQQRVMIAMALAGNPEVLIADEPTTALDVTVQAQILELLNKLRKERNMAILLISHNLGVVGTLADKIAVMYAGKIVEYGNAQSVITSPRHPYTKALLAAVPQLGRDNGRLQTIPGFVPSPDKYPEGCRFADRCQHVTGECRQAEIPQQNFDGGHCCFCCHPELDV